MKKFSLILIVFALIISACNSSKVKVRGDVKGYKGTVKLLAEIPGVQGLVVLDQQEVTDGKINLVTDSLAIPGRVWVDIAGKNEPLEFIVDTKDQIWIEGKGDLLNEKFGVTVKGSGLDVSYDDVKKLFKEKYEGPIAPIDRKIQKILDKEQRNKDEEVMLGVFRLQKDRYLRYRANYAKTLIKANPESELSLFILRDELKDSLDLQKKIFHELKIANKESNIYKTSAEKFK